MDTMRDRFTAVAARLLDEDPGWPSCWPSISGDRFADAARAIPDRVINVGIREQLLVGVGAAGWR